MNDNEVVNIKKNIVPKVLNIFQFWRNNDEVSFSSNSSESSDNNYGTKLLPSVDTFRRENGKVGRNDLCPCGSGTKYKKCYLH